MINELDVTGLAAIAELHAQILKSGYQLDNRVTFENQLSVVQVCKKGEAEGKERVIFESYFPIEVFRFLQDNGYLRAA